MRRTHKTLVIVMAALVLLAAVSADAAPAPLPKARQARPDDPTAQVPPDLLRQLGERGYRLVRASRVRGDLFR